MYKNKKILAIVLARGGSKGIPQKNIKNFDGRPLIYWTIDEAIKSRYIDTCIVSTEDKEIMKVVNEYPFTDTETQSKVKLIERPIELAADDTPSIAPVLHAVDYMPGYDYATLLQVTSPMRTAADIDGCIKHCIDAQAESCVSICEAESSPYWMYKLTNKGFIEPLMMSSEDAYQRQKLPRVYQLNGAVYVTSVSFLRREKDFVNSDTLGFVMSDRHSGDIDTLLDFEILAYLHSRR